MESFPEHRELQLRVATSEIKSEIRNCVGNCDLALYFLAWIKLGILDMSDMPRKDMHEARVSAHTHTHTHTHCVCVCARARTCACVCMYLFPRLEKHA